MRKQNSSSILIEKEFRTKHWRTISGSRLKSLSAIVIQGIYMRRGELVVNLMMPSILIIGITVAILANAPPLIRNISITVLVIIAFWLLKRIIKRHKNN
jgi:hypothetical protein